MRVLLCVLVTALFAAGCGGGKSIIREQESQIEALNEENQRLQERLRTMTARVETLEEERDALRREVEAARNTPPPVADAAGDAALERRIAELEQDLAASRAAARAAKRAAAGTATPAASSPASTEVAHVLTIPTDEYFEPAGARLTPAGVERLRPVLQDLKTRYPTQRIRVEGHTDETPLSDAVKETFPSNWELSAARAAMLVRHMQWTHQMDPSRFEVVGYGHYRPLASNATAAGRRQNRVVRIVVLAD